MIKFLIAIFIFTEKSIKIMMLWHLLESVPNKHVFFHLEIYRPGNLCSATVLNHNAVFLQFGKLHVAIFQF